MGQLKARFSKELFVYFLSQILQWFSYTAIFKILLIEVSGRQSLTPIYVAVLALSRGLSGFVLNKNRFFANINTYKILIGVGVALTIVQLFAAHSKLVIFFLLVTGLKLGLLTIFQIWRDFYTQKQDTRSHSTVTTIDFVSLALGASVGGILTSALSPIIVIGLDIMFLIIIFSLITREKGDNFINAIEEENVNHNSQMKNKLPLWGHFTKSFSDGSFQGLLPIMAYKHLNMSASVFGLSVSLSGVLIAIGAQLTSYLVNKIKQNPYYMCFIATVANALFLWLCFSSLHIYSFILWLGLASIASGIVLVSTRIVLISKSKQTNNIKRVSITKYYNAFRWSGLALGSFVLALFIRTVPFDHLYKVFMIIMTFSGIIILFGNFTKKSKIAAISGKINKLLLITASITFLLGSSACYLIFMKNPKLQFLKSTESLIMPYFSLAEMNMKISDLNETIRLTRNYSFPHEVSKVTIKTVNNNLIFEEFFKESVHYLPQDISEKIVVQNNKIKIVRDLYGFFKEIYSYHYLVKNAGPDNEDITISIILDTVPFFHKLYFSFILAILTFGISLFIGYRTIKALIKKIVDPLSKITIELESKLSEQQLPDKTNIISPVLAEHSLEVKRLIDSYNSLIKRLDEQAKLVAIGQTTSMLAHDIRKPLSQVQVVLDSFDIFKNNSSMLEQAKKDVSKAITNVEGMLHDVMDFSREVKLETKAKSLGGIFDFVIRQVVQVYNNIEIEFDYNFGAEFRPFVAEERFARVLSNIIGNGIEAITLIGGKNNGIIDITTKLHHDEKDYIEIIIGNDGPPFPKGIEDQLFESFYTSGKAKGTGLGLASAKKIVVLHEGEIFARNKEDGNGVEFIIRLPVSDELEDIDENILPQHSNDVFQPEEDLNGLIHSLRRWKERFLR